MVHEAPNIGIRWVWRNVSAMPPFHGTQKMRIPLGGGPTHSLGAIVDEDRVERGGPPSIRNTIKGGNNVPKFGFQDYEEPLPIAPAHLVDGPAPIVKQLIAQFLANNEVRGLKTMEQEKDNGLHVHKHHGTPSYDVDNVSDLAMDAPQAKTFLYNLMVNEGIAILVHLKGSSIMDSRDWRHLLRMAKDSIKIKKDEKFTRGLGHQCEVSPCNPTIDILNLEIVTTTKNEPNKSECYANKRKGKIHLKGKNHLKEGFGNNKMHMMGGKTKETCKLWVGGRASWAMKAHSQVRIHEWK